MKKVSFTEYGGPEVLGLVDVPDPEPGKGELLVATAAAGVNFIDLSHRSGAYSVTLPWTPGIEGCGTVLATGPGVEEFAEGDRVAWAACPGSYATLAVIPQERAVPVPDGIDAVSAAALMVQGMTAHLLAYETAELEPGSTVLVHAAAGGVGRLLCQLAVQRGATVIGTVSGRAKVPVALASGATHVIDYRAEDFAARAVELTEGRGVDVVYDAVGRDTWLGGLDCLRPRGLFVLYGQASGPVDPIPPTLLASKGSLYFTRPTLSHYNSSRDILLDRAAELFERVRDGRLRLRIHAEYPLSEAAAAHAALEERRVLGKLVLRPAA